MMKLHCLVLYFWCLPEMNLSSLLWCSPFRVYNFLCYKVDIKPGIGKECLDCWSYFLCVAWRIETNRLFVYQCYRADLMFTSRIMGYLFLHCMPLLGDLLQGRQKAVSLKAFDWDKNLSLRWKKKVGTWKCLALLPVSLFLPLICFFF